MRRGNTCCMVWHKHFYHFPQKKILEKSTKLWELGLERVGDYNDWPPESTELGPLRQPRGFVVCERQTTTIIVTPIIPWARQHSRHFSCVNSLNLHNSPIAQTPWLSPLTDEAGKAESSYLCKVTEPVTGLAPGSEILLFAPQATTLFTELSNVPVRNWNKPHPRLSLRYKNMVIFVSLFMHFPYVPNFLQWSGMTFIIVWK